jgi:hypothetical protein
VVRALFEGMLCVGELVDGVGEIGAVSEEEWNTEKKKKRNVETRLH